MSNPLAASFRSTNPTRNIVTPGEKVILTFSAAPKSAEDVQISVREDVTMLAGDNVSGRLIGAFKGRFVNGVYQNEQIGGAPPPPEPDPLTFTIALGPALDAPRLLAHTPPAELVASHTLNLEVRGRVKGASVTFKGQHQIHVEYPLAMVIPATNAARDPTLAVVRTWAAQWVAHKPQFRQTRTVAIGNPGTTLNPSDYDPLITALSDAATFAKTGVVALATGHGDDGDTNTIAWANLVPENQAPPENGAPFLYRLDIDEAVLGDGVGGTFPTGRNRKVKLDAIDRIGDALVAANARRLLLHTCRAGGSAIFMQRLADRLRVPVFAHRRQIEYTVAAPVLAAYAGETPRAPKAERQWPVARLGPLARPTDPPPNRFGV